MSPDHLGNAYFSSKLVLTVLQGRLLYQLSSQESREGLPSPRARQQAVSLVSLSSYRHYVGISLAFHQPPQAQVPPTTWPLNPNSWAPENQLLLYLWYLAPGLGSRRYPFWTQLCTFALADAFLCS